MLEKALGAAPEIVLPDLGKRMTESLNLGVPAVRRVPELRKQLSPLVREIAGVRTGGSSGSWLKRMLRK
jgi:pilus assembly protein CpaE